MKTGRRTHSLTDYEQHFARVLPLVGPALRERSVAVLGLADAALIVEHLAASGVRRWAWEPCDCASELAQRIADRHGTALDLSIQTLGSSRPDLIIAAGRTALLQAGEMLRSEGQPALLACVQAPRGGWRALHVLPDSALLPVLHWLECAAANSIIAQRGAWPDWELVTVSPLLAGWARALLLRGTPYQRDDLEQLWQCGLRQAALGGADALAVGWHMIEHEPAIQHLPAFQPEARRGCVLVAGLGSIGSVAASLLARSAERLVLADPDRIDLANPARQAYPLAAVGQGKAEMLARLLSAQGTPALAVDVALLHEQQVSELVQQQQVTAALVATGTTADFAIARALRAQSIPHVVARCYPRAQYWEAILVDGARGAGLADIRGRLAPGPAPAPTPEQIAAYSDAGALEAEPATLVESGWAAAWAARLTAQLALPAGLRARWLLELLAAERTCLIGGVGVQHTESGPAYAVVLPGQIHAWGHAQIGAARW